MVYPHSYWNYRITKEPGPDSESGFWYSLREVYYDKLKPSMYTEGCILQAETYENLLDMIQKINRTITEPVLDIGSDGKFVELKTDDESTV